MTTERTLPERALTTDPLDVGLWHEIAGVLTSAPADALDTPATREALTAAHVIVECERARMKALPEGQRDHARIARVMPRALGFFLRDLPEKPGGKVMLTETAKVARALITYDPLVETARAALSESTPQPDVRVDDAGNATATFPPENTDG